MLLVHCPVTQAYDIIRGARGARGTDPKAGRQAAAILGLHTTIRLGKAPGHPLLASTPHHP